MTQLETFLARFEGIQAKRVKHSLEVVASFTGKQDKRHEMMEKLAVLGRVASIHIDHEGKVFYNVPSFTDWRSTFAVTKTEFDYFNFCHGSEPRVPKAPETLCMSKADEKAWQNRRLNHGDMKTLSFGTYWLNTSRREWVFTILEQAKPPHK